jgi:hypothetical protein
MVKLSMALKNKINRFCFAHGVNLNRELLAREKGLWAVRPMSFDAPVNLELSIIADQIRSLNKTIAELQQTVSKEGEKLDGHKNLSSINGIGGLSGCIPWRITGDIDDFGDEAMPFSIAPGVSSRTEIEHWDRITKRGTKLGRTMPIQCALIAQQYKSLAEKVLRKNVGPSRGAQSHRRVSAQVAANQLSNAQERVGVRGLPNYCRRNRWHEPPSAPSLRKASLGLRCLLNQWSVASQNRGSERIQTKS